MKGFRVTRVLYVASIVLAGLACAPHAMSQAEISLPPTADTQSPTGVSFKTGGFNIGGITDLSIGGPGLAGLQLVRSYASNHELSLYTTNSQGWSTNTQASIVRNLHSYPPDQDPPPEHLWPMDCTVMTGASTSRFRCGVRTSWAVTPGNLLPYEQDGETLVFTKIGTGNPGSGSYFTFTDRTGAVFTYPYTGFPARLQSVTHPVT